MTALPSSVDVAQARLPQAYEAARVALANCADLDECRTWANKAQALASYARQSEDESLHKLATRIRSRAIRRCGELLQQFDGRGEHRRTDGGDSSSQRQAAAAAGMSERQQVTAVRVANVPDEEFEAAVESDSPPTITKLADMGRKPREPERSSTPPESEVPDWVTAPKPEGFKEATHFLGALRRYVEHCKSPELLANGLMPEERIEVRGLIGQVNSFHDILAVNLGGEA